MREGEARGIFRKLQNLTLFFFFKNHPFPLFFIIFSQPFPSIFSWKSRWTFLPAHYSAPVPSSVSTTDLLVIPLGSWHIFAPCLQASSLAYNAVILGGFNKVMDMRFWRPPSNSHSANFLQRTLSSFLPQPPSPVLIWQGYSLTLICMLLDFLASPLQCKVSFTKDRAIFVSPLFYSPMPTTVYSMWRKLSHYLMEWVNASPRSMMLIQRHLDNLD